MIHFFPATVSSSPGAAGAALLQCKREVAFSWCLHVSECMTAGTSFWLYLILLNFSFWHEVCAMRPGKKKKLSTGAGIHSHVGVDLQHHVLVLIKEEDAEGRHLLRDTARLRDTWDDAHCPHYALDGGVVRRLQSLWHGELAGPWAIVGIKRLGWYNPFAPSNVSKVNFQVSPSAVPGLVPLLLSCLFNCLLIKLEQGHFVPLILARLFTRPTCLFVFKWFIRTRLIPACRLIWILRTGKFIILQW